MKGKTTEIILHVVLVIGLLIWNYPGISSLYNRINEAEVISSQDNVLEQLTKEKLEKEKALVREYNARLLAGSGNGIKDTFSDEDNVFDEEYEGLLNIGDDGVMGAIEIPDIHVYLPISHGTSTKVLEEGAGHLKGTSLPIGGEDTHCVISAHRGLPSATLFTDADQIKKEDVFYLHVLKETLAYQVDQITVVTPSEVSTLDIEAGADYVTLLTCTPYGINSHRLLIRGKRIPYTKAQQKRLEQMVSSIWQWLLEQKVLLLSTGILLLYILGNIIRSIRMRRRYKSHVKRKRT